MAKGDTFPSEREFLRDQSTGVRLIRLTSGPGPNQHPYFHSPCLTPDGATMVFHSTRNGTRESYSLDWESGEVTQVTEGGGSGAALSHAHRLLYVLHADRLAGIDLDTLEERVLAEFPAGIAHPAGPPSESARSSYVAFQAAVRGSPGIAAADLATGEVAPVLEARGPIGHVQCSPAEDDLIMFCDASVPDNQPKRRIHVIRRDGSGESAPYPQQPGECVTHESWMGITGRIVFINWPLGMCSIRPDGSGFRWLARFNAWHSCANAHGTLVVADTFLPDRGLQLVEPATGRVTTLCHPHSPPDLMHPHPSFSPDGRMVVFDSAMTGTSQVYAAVLESVDTFPEEAAKC